jgi:hypothetical protein
MVNEIKQSDIDKALETWRGLRKTLPNTIALLEELALQYRLTGDEKILKHIGTYICAGVIVDAFCDCLRRHSPIPMPEEK